MGEGVICTVLWVFLLLSVFWDDALYKNVSPLFGEQGERLLIAAFQERQQKPTPDHRRKAST